MNKLIFLFFISIKIVASTYYVDATNGDDRFDGLSETTAWKTIAKINSMHFLPGDEILFKRGELWREKMIFPSSGTIARPIIIGAYGIGEKPFINGQAISSTSLNWIDKGNGVFGAYAYSVTNGGVSTILNVTENDSLLAKMHESLGSGKSTLITSTGQWAWDDASDTLFIKTKGSLSPELANIDLSIFSSTIHLGHSFPTAVNYVTVQDLKISGGYYNIEVWGQGVKVQNCTFINAYSEAVKLHADNPVDHDNPVHINYSQDALIYNNDISLFGGAAIDNTGGKNITISSNKIHEPLPNHGYKVETNGWYSMGILTKNKSVNCIIEYNHIYNSTFYFSAIAIGGSSFGGIAIEDTNAVVRYNLIENIHTVADKNITSNIIGFFASKDGKFYNNTIANCTVDESYVDAIIMASRSKDKYYTENPIVKNNIIYNSISASGSIFSEETNGFVSGLIINNNLYTLSEQTNSAYFSYLGKNYNSLSAWQEAGFDINSIDGNPLFYSEFDFSLQASSVAIDKGTDVGLTKDIIGNPIVKNPDIGAYEFQGEAPTGVYLKPIVILEGSILEGFPEDTLRTNNLISKVQPYNISPWNYNGSDSKNDLPDDMVDWVLLELRKDTLAFLSSRAAILLKSGVIVDIDGSSPVFFDDIPQGNYYIVVQHRNHLSIMSANKISLNENPITYDFTDSLSKAYGENSMKKLPNGKYAMYSGDSNSDGVINKLDYNIIADKIFSTGYLNSDLDMNGVVNVMDYGQVYKNILKQSNVPKRR